MDYVASTMNGFLPTYAPGFSVAAQGDVVSGHNSLGNSIVVQGNKDDVKISENIGKTPNTPSVIMFWRGGFSWIQQGSAIPLVWPGNGIHRSLEKTLPLDQPPQVPPAALPRPIFQLKEVPQSAAYLESGGKPEETNTCCDNI